MLKMLFSLMLALVVSSNSWADEPLEWDTLRVANNNRQTFVEADIPQSVVALVGKPMHIRGYMAVGSVSQREGLEKFGIWAETPDEGVSSNAWQTLPLHKFIWVEMDKGLSTNFILNAPVEISGTLSIDIRRVEGVVTSIYKMKAAKVSKATKRQGLFSAVDYFKN